MAPENVLLGQLVAYAGLIGGTIEYCEIIKRRADRRRLAAERQKFEAVGLHGLVRVFLADR